jgi:hypothetical protein
MSSLQQNWRKGKNRYCLERGVWGGEGEDGGKGLNDPNIVCTFAYMNKE